MRNRTFVLVSMVACMLIVTPLLAQNPTGTLTGRVFHEGTALPGVTVTADSPNLQGQKLALTGANGDYIFRFLPAGDYTVRFALDGFATLEMPVVISAAQSRTVDAEMYVKAVEEEILVTGEFDTVNVGTQSSVTIQSSVVEKLPVGRDLNNAVLLTAGTTSTGPGGNITISGAQSYENLFLINGVVTNENLRGQSFGLFIEDAIQETTTSTSGVSAEYGRFAGGVVNMLTKSGGNQFSGSFRVNLTNDSWSSKTPLTTDQADEINEVYEATFGGYVLRDKLWFFLAGRDRTNSEARQLYDLTPYNYEDTETRYEGKLTWSMHPNHRLIGSYMEIEAEQGPYDFFTALEPRATSPGRQLPQDLLSFNYTGVITENFFLEAQYAERTFTFQNSGGDAAPGDRINGTVIYYPNFGAQANSDVFCGTCGDEKRDMENALAKASWFLSTDNAGTHDMVFGVDTYNDIRLSNNYQSPSNFFIWNYNDPTYGSDGTFYPVFTGGEDLDYWPIFLTSNGTDFTTNSAYVNDTWRLNNNWTINLGLRYDKNDGQDGAGKTVADDSRFSPRIGASWDINGDGEWIVNASVARTSPQSPTAWPTVAAAATRPTSATPTAGR
jgi:outer membrane receptor protein involved in Fe transport